MNRIFICLAALFVVVSGLFTPVMAQMVILEEDFRTGIHPEWAGIPGHFTTVEDGGQSLLRLNGDSGNGGVSRLSIPVHAAYGEWEFYVMLDFATSNNNRSYVHLFSNVENPREGNGYAIRIGESGSAKHFRLVRFDDGRESGVITHGDRLIEAGKGYSLKITRSRTGIWQIYSDEGRASNPQPDGLPGFDNTHSSTGWFVFEAIYTSTRSDRFYWGDLRITKDPAFLMEAGRNGPGRISIRFSESDMAGAGNPDSYRIVRDTLLNTEAQNPVSVVQNSPVSYDLIFAASLAGGPAWLELYNIFDYYGQEPAQNVIELMLHDVPERGSVVISEFLYDDTGGLPQYVELYNPGPGWYNVQDWELRDRGSTSRVITANPRTLEPDRYLVVTVSAQGMQNRFGPGPWLQMERFPSLNRASSDQIRIIAPGGSLIDSLEYVPVLLNAGGRSVERRSAFVDARYSENWAVSEHDLGGTPGYPNTAGPPEARPELSEIRPADARTIALQFSRPMDPGSLKPGNITLLPPIQVESITVLTSMEPGSLSLSGLESEPASSSGTEKESEHTSHSILNSGSDPGSGILLHLAEPMANATEYTLNLEPVTDIFGLPILRPVQPFTFYLIEEAGFRDVVINEILYRPLEGITPRFIEVVNRSDRNIDLSGWTIGRSSASVQLGDSPGFILKPGNFAVISALPGLADVPETAIHMPVNLPGYSRFGDAVYLRNRDGYLIDSLFYLPAWGGDADGRSLERIDPDAASNDPVNWRPNTRGHSAGRQNLNYHPDLSPPGVVKALFLEPDTVEILFTEFLDTSIPPVVRSGHTEAEIVFFDSFNANRLTVRLPYDPEGAETLIEIHGVVDVAGNSSGVLELPLAYPPGPGDLVINEIMYQPLQNRYGSYPDQSQYVEFYNRSGRTVSLMGLHLHDEPDKDGIVRTVEPSGRETAWLPPGGYGIIHADTAGTFTGTALSRFFLLEQHPSWLQARRSTLNLTSSGRPLYLAGMNALVFDALTYRPDWHNPNLADTRGISLERIHPGGPSDDARNWSSNVTPDGGTPGAPNSILQQPEPGEAQRALSVSPNPFSPDGDGFDDHLFISYRLDSPGYLVTIRIYDRYGRLVRKLANRERAGFDGHFIWDGLSDDGISGRIGIYIILFDAQDPVNGKRAQLKQTAVLARQM